MNCNVPTDILFSFAGFAERGGRSDHHADGWGIAFFEGKGVRHFVDHRAAISSPVADLVKATSIKSTHVIAHIRKATQGEIALENCHPFVRELWGQYWVCAHNGDLKDFFPAPGDNYRPVGTTDSERAFCHLLEQLRARFGATAPSETQLQQALADIVMRIAEHGTYNLLLSNGNRLYAHCSTRLHYLIRQYPFGAAELKDQDLSIDFRAVTTPEDRVAIIVTEPLTSNEDWTPMSPGQLYVFVDGQLTTV